MIRLRNIKRVLIFTLVFLFAMLMLPDFVYAIGDPTIDNLNPASAHIGDEIEINGSNFGVDQGAGKVSFEGAEVVNPGDITSWSDTQIVLDIPAGAKTGNVTVTTDAGFTSNTAALTIEPKITSVNPTTVSIGDALTINGTGFEDAQGAGKITFVGSGDTAAVTSWSSTQIVLNVPAGTRTGTVTVTTDAGLSYFYGTLTIKPDITNINPGTAAIGQEITITGTNFGNVIGSGKVTFAGSGDTTAVTSWSNTEIKLNVPAGTVTGDVTVTEVSGVATSDPETLTITTGGGIVVPPVTQEHEPDPWERIGVGYYEKNNSGFLTMLYSRFFRRPPDQTGFDNWLAWIESGDVTGEDLMMGFIFSEECQAEISEYANSEFILFLYEVFFDREPSDENYGIWLSRMDAGMSKEEVVTEFCHSDEFISLCSLFGIVPYAGYTAE